MSDANLSALRYVKESSFAASPGGARASGTVTFSVGIPTDLDTITVNGQVYTFKTGALTAAFDVFAGSTFTEAATNFAAAINATASLAGTAFHASTTANPFVSATRSSGVVTLTSLLQGTVGNSYTLAESATNVVVSGGVLTGGAQTIYSAVTALRFNSETLQHAKVTVMSEEIRSDRTIYDLVKVGIGANGGTVHELHWGDLNTFIASAMQTPLVSGSDTAATWSFTSNVLSKSVTIPAALGKAKYVKISGFVNAANNGIKRVVSISGNNLTLESGPVNEAAGPTVTVSWAYTRQGTTLESYLIEKDVAGAGDVIALLGMCVNTMVLNLSPRAKAMLDFTFLGYGANSRLDSAGMTTNSPSANPIYNTTSHISTLLLAGTTPAAAVRALTFSVNNNLRERLALAREGTLVPGTGSAELTGTMEIYFDAKSIFDMYVNHDGPALEFAMRDDDGRLINVYCPKVRFSGTTPQVPGLNQDVVPNMAFQAVRGTGHDGSVFQAQIDLIAP